MKRVGIIALLHESNTFLDEPTTLEHFRTNLLAEGSEVVEAFRDSPHEVGGFIDAIGSEPDIEMVGVFGARAMPFGTISDNCWRQLTSQLEAALRKAMPLDGLLVAPHGATVAENASDADGDWLERVRRIVGPDMPIIGTLDLHANVSSRMVRQCQALFGYRTNPHLDQRLRGLEAGRTMIRTLKGEIRPQLALAQLPLCINIERQATSEEHGRVLWNEADRLQHLPGMLSVSCLYGFPYSDVAEMGATVIAVSDGKLEQRDPTLWLEHFCSGNSSISSPVSRSLAQTAADAMAAFWWNRRADFVGQLISVEDAIHIADEQRARDSGGPVGLLEMGDNVGGGSPGDGTWIVHGWLARKTPSSGLSATFSPWKGEKGQQERLLTVIADPAAVQLAIAAGGGETVRLPVGGKLDPRRHGPPIEDTFRVLRITDGKFSEAEIRHGGYSRFDQGTSVVLEGASGVTIIATTRRVAPMSLQQVLSQGLRPEDFSVIVIKGVHAPVAAYGPVCSRLVRVNTRGATTADLRELTFHHRRHPMEPFETMEVWRA
jgi:microcystin degradation protein MlrC